MIRQLLRASLAFVAATLVGGANLAYAADSNIGETSEVQFTSADAAALRNKAALLSSPVEIYEYLKNNYDYGLYQGARSGSVNTFLGGRGSDVDLAATLISMLRSQGIPARYAVGTIRVPASQVANWLQVEDASLAKNLLINQGIQNVTSTTAGATATLDFEHVWVEALLPYNQYRGVGTQAISCTGTTPPSTCHWVPLDPSFKKYKYSSSGLDPYAGTVNGSNVGATNFDYSNALSGYYYVLKNTDAASVAKRDKNPLEIYQEQVLSWLRTNAPGKTLQDIPNFQGIVRENNGLLPASLPYTIVGTARKYNSVADHDAVVPATESKAWAKTLSLNFKYLIFSAGIGSPLKLTELNSQRLTVSTELNASGGPEIVVRLGGQEIARPLSIAQTSGFTPKLGDPFTMTVSMDGSPGSSTNATIQASYDAMVGGYYLVATGGEGSNWSQVHRAADQLLNANQQYAVVFNSAEAGCVIATGLNCTPYIDSNGNGWDASDPKLQNNRPALDALTGGLLYVAATQYYAKLKDGLSAVDQINKIKTPISGFLGVVSSTYQPEYINSTAFSILPSGLLIDMKGISIGGSWRINAPDTASNAQFSLVGHMFSSLEHEVWQQLTGYDAISTVRGIQIALANGASLLNPKKSATVDTMSAAYTGFGFSNGAAPAGFTYAPFNLFGTTPSTWTNATSGASMDVMRSQISATTPAAQTNRATYVYAPSGGLYGWVSCVNGHLNTLNSYIAQGVGNQTYNNWSFCNGTTTSATVNSLVTAEQNLYINTIIPNIIGQSYFDYFNGTKGFAPANHVFRANPVLVSAQPTSLVQSIRNSLYLQADLNKSWMEYWIPSSLSVGSNFLFAVYIVNNYDAVTGSIGSSTYGILNQSGIAAGGGFVDIPNKPQTPGAAYSNADAVSK